MLVIVRLALVGVFLVLTREGVRLIGHTVFLLEENSPFLRVPGALIGIAALVIAVVCIALACKPNYLPRPYLLGTSIFCVLLFVAALEQMSMCKNLALNVHLLEIYACQRSSSVALGSAIASVLMVTLWMAGRLPSK